MLKKDKPMMSVTAIIQGAQAQHWGRALPGNWPLRGIYQLIATPTYYNFYKYKYLICYCFKYVGCCICKMTCIGIF